MASADAHLTIAQNSLHHFAPFLRALLGPKSMDRRGYAASRPLSLALRRLTSPSLVLSDELVILEYRLSSDTR